MKFGKRICSLLICGALSLSTFSIIPALSMSAEAATFEQVNASSVFVKQQTSTTCTLASNVMMLRRTALMNGDPNWASITESACRPTLWCSEGMYHYYTYQNITVSYQYISSSQSVTTQLKNALAEHPEGIVIYDYDYPHAILLTDYTDGVFYCADPANNVASGRIKASQSLINVEDVEAYWYVTSPDVSFTDSSVSGSESISEQWKITSSNGVNIRSGAGTSYSIVGTVPYNATVTVTKKTTSGGYTWGYITYNGYTGWIALDYATIVNSSTSSELKNTSSMSATTINAGSSVTLNATASGGTTPYKFAYSYKHESETAYTALKSYSTTSSYTWTPDKTGKYSVCIKVKDAKGTEIKKFYTLTVKSSALKNSSTMSATTINAGSSVTLNAAASGGTTFYKFGYSYKYASDTTWTALKSYSTTSSYTWKPEKPGTYNVCIKVKDTDGTEIKKFYTLTVSPSSVKNNSTVSATSISLGSTITLKGSASGGTSPYKFGFSYRQEGEITWTALKSYSTTSSYTWKPTKKGTYNVCIKIKDATGTEVKNFYTITVK